MRANKKRNEMDNRYKWKLEDIYAANDAWEQDFKLVREYLELVIPYQNQIGESAKNLWGCLQDSEKLDRLIEKLYIYARMRRDEDNANDTYQRLFARIEALAIEAGSMISFIIPEISSIEEELIYSYMEEEPKLKQYSHFFAELFRLKDHILSPAEEKIIAMSADLSISSRNIFTMLNNADIKFAEITDENGNKVEVTKGRYGGLMESPNREVRKSTFDSLYDSYGKLINTIGASLNGSVKSDIFYAKVRKYSSSLEAALASDNIEIKVYESLIDSVHQHLPSLHRYMELRKKMLGLDSIHMYDLYNPLVAEHNVKVGYEKAHEILLKGLAPLGKDYLATMIEGLDGGWVDVYENEGKTSGAYSWGAYDTHPYILMNYDDKLNDIFTLAHELGHSMHTYYSNRKQPYTYSKYSIFLAEVASTVNESLLIDYLIANSSDKREKMYLINHYLEQFRGTVFRQTMFAEFEKIIHEIAEQGEALTPQRCNEIYLDLNRMYYGKDVVLDEQIAWEWARIPHFYSSFYVYKYATGFSAATAIKQSIISEGEKAVKDYMEFLTAGSSDYPLEILKKTGVDLTTSIPINNALDYFKELLDQLEDLSS